jgi:phosphonate transport system permease protein
MIALGAFTIALGLSIWISKFYPDRLAEGVPRIFEYFGTIMPDLQWDSLFEGRDANGNAVPGSMTFWYTDFWTYVELIWETILMAITATLIGTAVAFALSFPGGGEPGAEFVDLLALAPVPGILPGRAGNPAGAVLRLHDRDRPAGGHSGHRHPHRRRAGQAFRRGERERLRPPGRGDHGRRRQLVREDGLWRRAAGLPNFFSYAMLRFEINVRASSIIGFVGAGGIGQELNRVISFYSDDRVLAVLILVVLMVTVIDLISERIRLGYIGRENFQ